MQEYVGRSWKRPGIFPTGSGHNRIERGSVIDVVKWSARQRDQDGGNAYNAKKKKTRIANSIYGLQTVLEKCQMVNRDAMNANSSKTWQDRI